MPTTVTVALPSSVKPVPEKRMPLFLSAMSFCETWSVSRIASGAASEAASVVAVDCGADVSGFEASGASPVGWTVAGPPVGMWSGSSIESELSEGLGETAEAKAVTAMTPELEAATAGASTRL